MKNNYSNPDLYKKYMNSASFRQQMDKIEEIYKQKIQESIYADLSSINPKIIQKVTQTVMVKSAQSKKSQSGDKDIIILYSHFHSNKISQLQKLYLYLITKLPEPQKPYYFMYVSSSQSSKAKNWAFFKSEILEQLPINYLLFLQKVILVKPSLMDKASSLVNFGTINRFIRDKCSHYSSVKQFFADIGANQEEIFKMIPQQIQFQENGLSATLSLLPLICNLNQRQESQEVIKDIQDEDFGKIEEKKDNKALSATKNNKKKRIKTLQNYPTGELGIPLAVELLFFYFSHKPQRCQAEGIFRKCSSIDDETELINQLEKENYEILTEIDNNIAVASALKIFLRNLQPPLIPYEHYNNLLEKNTLADITQQIHTLPIINFMTLMHLIKFLREYIMPRSKKNLMNVQNISICFAPCLMRCKQITEKDLLYAPISVKITKTIIQRFQDIFGDVKQQNKLQRSTFKMYRLNSKKNQQNQQNSKGQKLLDKDLRLPSFGCPDDFLKPANHLIDHCKQDSLMGQSEASVYSNNNSREPSNESNKSKKSVVKNQVLPGIMQFLKKTKSGDVDQGQQSLRQLQMSSKSVGNKQESNSRNLLEVPGQRGSMATSPRIFKSNEKRNKSPSNDKN